MKPPKHPTHLLPATGRAFRTRARNPVKRVLRWGQFGGSPRQRTGIEDLQNSKRRKSFRISVRSGFDSQALPPLDSRVELRGPRSWQATRLASANYEAVAAAAPRASPGEEMTRKRAVANALSDPERVHGSGRVEGSKGQTPAPGFDPASSTSSSAPTAVTTSARRPTWLSASGSTTKDTARRTRRLTDRCAWCTRKPTSPGLRLASAKPKSSAGPARRRTPSSRGTNPSFTNSRDAGAVDLVRSPTFRRRTDRHRFSWGCRSGLAGCSLVSADVDINRRFGPWSRSRRMYR